MEAGDEDNEVKVEKGHGAAQARDVEKLTDVATEKEMMTVDAKVRTGGGGGDN